MKSILFFDDGDGACSSMALALARPLAPVGVRLFAAAGRPAPLDARVAAALDEIGVAREGCEARRLDELGREATDTIDALVVVRGEGRAAADALPRSAIRVLWHVADPERAGASAVESAAVLRIARDHIRARAGRLMVMASPDAPLPLLSKRRVYDGGTVVKVDREQIRLPSGGDAQLDIIHHPGASAVAPLRADGTVVLIRQYRHAALDYILEVPAGKLDAGESPEQCALREIAEEAGLRAGSLHSLGFIYTTPGFTDEVIHLFAATRLEAVERAPEHDEVIEVVEMPLARALELVASNEIRDSKSICALVRAEHEIRAGRLRAE